MSIGSLLDMIDPLALLSKLLDQKLAIQSGRQSCSLSANSRSISQSSSFEGSMTTFTSAELFRMQWKGSVTWTRVSATRTLR
jgi:hypothetical protein